MNCSSNTSGRRYGAVLLKEKNVDSAKKCTAKSKDIINYLLVILDDHYSIATNLRKIYSAWLGQIVRANAYEDAAHLERILPEVQDLRDAWAQAEKATHIQKT